MSKSDECPHENWTVDTAVHRTTGPGGALAAVALTVKATCKDCGTPFWFPGLQTGTSYSEPTTTTDGFTLSAPMVQANRRLTVEPNLPSMTIRNGDILKGRRST